MVHKPLDPAISERMDQLGALHREARSEGRLKEAESLMIDVWNLVPEPKEQCDHTTSILNAIVSFYRDTGQHAKSLDWLARWERAAQGMVHDTIDVFAGTVLFEAGRLDEAYVRFSAAYDAHKSMPFQGENPKYLAFVKERRKQKK